MDNSVADLSEYRLNRAKEDLEAASKTLELGEYKTSANRSYYSMFHAVRALLALKGIDFKKHSGVISYFNKEYIKTEIFPKQLSGYITGANKIRQSSDYDDFFIATKEEAQKQLENEGNFIQAIEAYLKSK